MSVRSSVLLAMLLTSILLSSACGVNQRARGEPKSTEPPKERVADKASTVEQTTAVPAARQETNAGTRTEDAAANAPKRHASDDPGLPRKQDPRTPEREGSSRPPKPGERNDGAVSHGPNILQEGAPGDVRREWQKGKGQSRAPGGGALGSKEAHAKNAASGRPPDLSGNARSGGWLPERCLDRLPGPEPKWCDKMPQSARTPTR